MQSLNVNISIVLAICLSAIIWNLGTWYLGIPCSSSHTLIGAILGAGLGFATMYSSDGVNWRRHKISEHLFTISCIWVYTCHHAHVCAKEDAEDEVIISESSRR